MSDSANAGDLGQALAISEVLSAFRRHWVLLVGGLVAGIVGGFLIATLLPPSFEASETILIQPTGVDLNQAESRESDLVQAPLEIQLVRSTDVLAEAARSVTPEANPEGLRRNLVVTNVQGTPLLVLSVTAETSGRALELVEAIVGSYFDQREQRAVDDLNARTNSVTTRLQAAESDLADVNEDLADIADDAVPNVGRQTLLEGSRDVLTSTVIALQQELAALEQINTVPGRVTERPRITDDGGLGPILTIIGGTMLGLFLGAGLALLRDRADTRLWSAAEVERLVPDVPVVMLTASEMTEEGFLDGPTYREVRDLVISFPVPSPTTLVLLSPRTDGAVGYVAGGVAGAISRAGLETLLLDPNGFSGIDDVAAWLGVEGTPPTRLDDYLFRDLPLAQVAVPAPRRPNLLLLRRSQDAIDRDVTVAPRLRTLLWRQDSRAEARASDSLTVSVAGPGVIDSPDGAVLGGMGDSVVLVCRQRVTTSEDLLRSLRSLRTHAASLVAIVLVPTEAPG